MTGTTASDPSLPKRINLSNVNFRNPMKKTNLQKHSLEVLEGRIAPAAVPIGAQWIQASHSADGTAIPLSAGMGLSSGGQNSGDYLLFVEKGDAWVFTTDFNNNNIVDYNEITGIAAGDGLRLISFVDIRGDIVTNLVVTQGPSGKIFSLSDSNNNPSDDNPVLRGDGRVVLNNRIEKIELRTLTIADIPDQDRNGVVNQLDVDFRRAPSTHSIFGNVYAGGGFGVPGDASSGLLIDRTVTTNFGFEDSTQSYIGSIRAGTAVSGEYFSFSVYGQFESSGGVMQQRVRAGLVLGDDTQGYLVPFVPAPGQAGASIAFVRSASPDQTFNLNGLYAGDGGAGAAGGSILDVTVNHDDSGGYNIVAGNGGSGTRGGAGGSILRFSDLNSDTSKVVIRSGSGGDGSTGAGGNAGSADFLNSNFYGNYSIILGDGGTGFTQGGNGASLARGVVVQPFPADVPNGTSWGTSHSPSYFNEDPSQQQTYVPHIGTSQGFDIDGDGFGDYVFSTLGVSQIVVMFGDGFGGFRTVVSPDGLQISDRIYLASPRNAEALTVADLDGDGRPDIAAASSDISNQAGISVFIAKWEDVNKDGDVMDPDDRFVGYYDPRLSALPQIESGDSATGNAFLDAWQGPQRIAEIVAGDFDGDGTNELAVLMEIFLEKEETNGITTSLTRPSSVIMFLSPDRELDTNTGQFFLTGKFYADFGTRKVEVPGQPAADPAPRLPYVVTGNNLSSIIIEATALTEDATHDVILYGKQGGDNSYHLGTVEYFFRDPAGTFSAAPILVENSWDLGSVDTNRNPRQGNNPNTNTTDIGLHDFTVVDFNSDGIADVIALSASPGNYVVGVLGDGLGGGDQDSTDPDDGDQAGFFLGNNFDARGIKAAIATPTGGVSDFIVLFDDNDGFHVTLYDYNTGPSFPGLSGPTSLGNILTATGNPEPHVSQYRSGVTDNVMWDIYYPDLSSPLYQVGVGPESWERIFGLFQPTTESGLSILAGDGGDSFIGKGGNGGFIGGKGRLLTIVDPNTGVPNTDFAGALQITFDGRILLQAGDGGLGFSRGGNGGSISGVSVRDFTPDLNPIPIASLIAGDGGRGVSGAGGFGGDLIANSIFNGFAFLAGDGGDGRTGGRGGAVIGNGQKVGTTRIFDTETRLLEVQAGNGGNGLRGGGAGGTITNFRPILDGIAGAPGSAGSLSYVAGHGGNSVSGVGGAGGSVLNSSPELNATLQDQIQIQAGEGGDGRTGGAGGSISGFAVTQGTPEPTKVAGLVAGHGGNGTTGAGGRGGSITAVSVLSVGAGNNFSLPFASFSGRDDLTGTFFTYSRIMAGDGGLSIGGRGGDGGSVSNAVAGISNGTIAVVGGAGGSGMTQGGLGGSVLNFTMQGLGAGSTSKALIVSGAGGDARAYIPNPNDNTPDQDKKAFGGRIGQGGNGGSIKGYTQFGDSGGHTDLIAGNGGDSVNYGTEVDKKSYVGRGGSILNVSMTGSVGNIAAAIPIKSYNDILNGESMKSFVERKLRDGEALFESLGDGDGNVGFVVGSAGRNKAVAVDPFGNPFEFASQPAVNAKNGDLMNIRVNTIMSAVAGSVDRIAAIQLAHNIQVQATNVGTDKGVVGVTEFLDLEGEIVSTPVRDGGLIDGAFVARKLTGSNIGGNVFPGF
jgi:hypothetical protein